jgi:prepilin-type N-terminal cleavage/methylation domain-containing protein
MRLNNNRPASQHQRWQPKSGFTLVEVLCAIAISTIVVTVLFYGLNNGFAIIRTTRDDLRATQILLQNTEAFRLYTWTQLSNCPATFQTYYNPTGTTGDSAGTLYYGTLSTTAPATNVTGSVSYAPYLHLITITVVWTNNIGTRLVGHSRQMQTLSALNGMQNYFSRTNL